MIRFCAFIGFLVSVYNSSAQRTGNDYALFFYVTEFRDGWSKLPETAKETDLIKNELESNFGFKCESIGNPTKAKILSKIKEYNNRLTPDDQILFFFSMHGHYNELSERGFLVAADGELSDDYGDTWLSYDELSGYLALSKAKHVLLALDACHSGSFGIRNKSRPDEPTYAQAEDCTQRVTRMLKYSGRQYCSSGNKESKTPAKSLFASRFLEALRKGGEGDLVRFDDLEYYLGKVESPRPESGTFKGHEPSGDFVFIRKGNCFTPVIKDRDADGIADAEDKCPDNFGIKSNAGCPESRNTGTSSDADYDGIPDSEDNCPDKYGTKANAGCPETGIFSNLLDKDRDGILDEQDGCPNDFGTAKAKGCPDRDDDGIADKDDRCPTESGTALANGCPDRDMDGVPDKSDKCKDSVGESRWQGCPDSDGDGLPDHEDICPNAKGLLTDNGCPPSDLDSDGVPDKSDMCKNLAGEARWQGCPDTDGDGLPDHEDICPKQKGLAVDKGCPPSDRDKDGVPDFVDKCPDTAGKTNLEGCPDISEEKSNDKLNDIKFTVPTQKFVAPAIVTFTNNSLSASTAYEWDFGDGSLSTEVNPTHRFVNSGNYLVTLKASNGKKSKTFKKTVQVAAPEKNLVEIETEFGIMLAELYDATPKHRDNFIKLADEGYFNDLLFHRVISNFMIQGGDPDSRNAPAGKTLGMGGPSYRIPAEFVDSLCHIKGVLAAARSNNPEKKSSGSQFYIVQGSPVTDQLLSQIESKHSFRYTPEQRANYAALGGTPHLDREYTVFGRIIKGLDVIDKIAAVEIDSADRPKKDVKMKVRVIK